MNEAKNQINDLEHKEEKEKNTTQNKNKKESKNNEYSISSLWDNFTMSYICIIGLPEVEKKEQEIRNLFEKVMKENCSNLVNEIDM